MRTRSRFIGLILDSLAESVVVLDRDGRIVLANRPWTRAGLERGIAAERTWLGEDYVAASAGNKAVAEGLRDILASGGEFEFEYPCHGPGEKRWFLMRARSVEFDEERFVLVSHRDITRRWLAEQRAIQLSRIDPLTGLSNRRAFDEAFETEWRRAIRAASPVTLAIIDLDHFKVLNDTCGHRIGDEVLRAVGPVVESVARRPGDMVARVGGEEFAVLLVGTDSGRVRGRLLGLLSVLRSTQIKLQPELRVTASAGVASVVPSQDSDRHVLYDRADALLYEAKQRGRDRLVAEGQTSPDTFSTALLELDR